MVFPRINDFIANLDKHKGPAKSERFYVSIIPPQGLGLGNVYDLQYQCEETDIPGLELETSEYRIYGLTKKIAVGRIYEPQTLHFFLTDDYYEKPFFDSWIEYINPQGDKNNFDMNYKNLYTGTIVIYKMDKNQNIVYSVSLIEAFPISISPIPGSWHDDSNQKLSVTFAYTLYNPSNENFNSIPDGSNPNTSNLVSINPNNNPFTA